MENLKQVAAMAVFEKRERERERERDRSHMCVSYVH